MTRLLINDIYITVTYKEDYHLGDEAEILRIFRLLKPKRQADLLTWVRVARKAENSIRKSLGLNAVVEDSCLIDK